MNFLLFILFVLCISIVLNVLVCNIVLIRLHNTHKASDDAPDVSYNYLIVGLCILALFLLYKLVWI